MRIATWNVNSLKARQEAVEKWLARAEPDVLLIQETKLSDAEAPEMPMRMLGYEMAHHGEGRWNGVAILSRVGIDDVITNFGDGPVRDSSAGATVAVPEQARPRWDHHRRPALVTRMVRRDGRRGPSPQRDLVEPGLPDPGPTAPVAADREVQRLAAGGGLNIVAGLINQGSLFGITILLAR